MNTNGWFFNYGGEKEKIQIITLIGKIHEKTLQVVYQELITRSCDKDLPFCDGIFLNDVTYLNNRLRSDTTLVRHKGRIHGRGEIHGSATYRDAI